jgi:hypothetical protein
MCKKCDSEAKMEKKRQEEAFKLQQKRDAEQLEYSRRLSELEEKIAHEQQALIDQQVAEDRARVLGQKQLDLQEAADRTAQAMARGIGGHFQLSNPLRLVPSATSQSNNTHETQKDSMARATPNPPIQPVQKDSQTNKTEKDLMARATPSPDASSTGSAQKDSQTKTGGSSASDMQASGKVAERFPPTTQSPSKMDWQRQKDMEGASNRAIDAIMDMIGLEEVKKQVLAIKAKVDVTKRQGTSLKDERFNVVMVGNPGTGTCYFWLNSGLFTEKRPTGKTTVARHYAKFLTSCDVLPGSDFVETTGSRLAHGGVDGIKKQIEGVLKAGGGTVFVDEAYQLAMDHNTQGKQVLDFLLAEMENNVGKIVFILAGYDKEMEKFFEHNPGLRSRVPYTMKFEDYKDAELLSMLEQLIEKKFKGRMKVEEGIRGLYGRVAICRLGRGRGHHFGNARALHNMSAKVLERQSTRLQAERRDGNRPDDFLLIKEDLIGPDPAKVIVQSAAWKKLQNLTGLKAVKDSVRNLFDLIEVNYLRELKEREPVQMSLNRVFLGSPGTGKTTVAKLYGQILAELGLLSNGEGIKP